MLFAITATAFLNTEKEKFCSHTQRKQEYDPLIASIAQQSIFFSLFFSFQSSELSSAGKVNGKKIRKHKREKKFPHKILLHCL